MRFEYPTNDFSDENASLRVGSSNSFGFFPVNVSNAWHGGFHLEGLGEKIVSIAAGKIIAFRIPRRYTSETLGGQTYHYSNGFVLVQHEYNSPKNQRLTFFSLYMHLMPSKFVQNGINHIPHQFTKGIKDAKGLRARKQNKTIAFVIPKGEKVTLETHFNDYDRSPDHWTKLPKSAPSLFKKVSYKDRNGTLWTEIYISTKEDYVKTVGNQLEIISETDVGESAEIFSYDGTKLDKIVNCSIDIKAGELVGYAGKYGFEKQPNYCACHMEVFISDNVDPFLTDAKKDGDNEKHYLKLLPGAVLKKAYPGKILGDGQLKVKIEENFSEVQLQSITRTVLLSDLNQQPAVNGVIQYKIKTGTHFTRVYEAFDKKVNQNSILLHVSPIVEAEVQKRKVTYKFVPERKKCWIASNQVPPGTGEIRDSTNEISTIYEEKPDLNLLQETVNDEFIIAKKKCRKVTYSGGDWYFIDTGTQKGWIKLGQQLTEISAYDWVEFGFNSIEDAEDQFIYDPTNPPAFLRTLWGKINKDNKIDLSSLELNRAFRNLKISKELSRMVCSHISEWSWIDRWETFKPKVKKLYEDGIEREQDSAEKDKLKARRDETINALEARLRKLCFWKEIIPVPEVKEEPVLPWFSSFSAGWFSSNPAPVANPEPALPPKKFPTANPKVYHFHPIAFVEQMRRLESGCFCNRDLTEQEVKQIVVSMRKSEPEVYVGNNKENLFFGYNCDLPEEDKNYARLTEELNKTFKQYNINLCIRKIHFFAQTYWEGDRYRTMLEYGSGKNYNPGEHAEATAHGHIVTGDGPRYKGRGLMQLTWRDSQKKYLESVLERNPNLLFNKTINQLLNRSSQYQEKVIYYTTLANGSKKKNIQEYDVDFASLIARNLFLAVDSAGWFWDVYKKYNGNNLNHYADYGDKYIDWISTLVNGGSNGKPERKKYYETLRDEVFKIKTTCINYDSIKS